jgi:uncharacterized protein (TIRG00374 family)
MKRQITFAVGFVITALSLYIAFRNMDFVEVYSILRQARYEFVALSLLIMIGNSLVRGWRWYILMQRRLPFADSFWLWNAGFLFNNILPAKLGEVIRALLASRRPGISFPGAASSIIVERQFDSLSVVLMFGLALLGLKLPGWATRTVELIGIVSLAGIIAMAYVARHPEGVLNLGAKVLSWMPGISLDKALSFLTPFVEGLGGLSDLRTFVGAVALTVAAWLCATGAAWTFMLAFWPEVPLSVGLLVTATTGLGIAIPSAPAGLGPFEAIVVATLVAVGYDTSASQGFAIARHAQLFVFTSVLGIIGLLRDRTDFWDTVHQARTVKSKMEVAGQSK